MTYLLLQIWIGLLITFILGVVLGYFMGKNCSSSECGIPQQKSNDNKSNKNTEEPEIPEVDASLDGDDYAIETIEGIGKYTGERFRGAGISTVGDVLRQLEHLSNAKSLRLKWT